MNITLRKLFSSQSLQAQLVLCLVTLLLLITVLCLIFLPMAFHSSTAKTTAEVLTAAATLASKDSLSSDKYIVIYKDVNGSFQRNSVALNTDIISAATKQRLENQMSLSYDSSYNGVVRSIEINNETSVYYIIIEDGNGLVLLAQTEDMSAYPASKMLIKYVLASIAICIFLPFVLMFVWISMLSSSIQDISGFLKAYTTEFDSNNASSREILELYTSSDQFKQAIIETNKEKQELFQNLSHELKTPITTIKLYADAIQDGVMIQHCENTNDMAVIIGKEADNLLSKVEKIMTINKLTQKEQLDKQKHTYSKVNLSDVLFDVMNTYQLRAPNVTFSANLQPVNYRGTRETWKTILENIFDNNIRHGATSIKISCNDKYLTITNNGDPIDEKLIPQLFEPFVRGRGGNFGLGLGIIKQSLEMLNYSVKLYNSDDGDEVVYSIIDRT